MITNILIALIGSCLGIFTISEVFPARPEDIVDLRDLFA